MSTSPGTVAGRLVDAFLLRSREKVAALRTPAQQESIARWHTAGLARARGARELFYAETAAAIALYREAAIFLIAAIGEASGAENVELRMSASAAWRDFDSIEGLRSAPKPQGLARAREVLASDDPLAPDALPQDGLREVAAAAQETVRWLAKAIEARGVREIRTMRGFRIAGAVIVLVVVLYKVGFALFGPKNLALGKPAFASSMYPGSPPPEGINNGEIEAAYGYQTRSETNPWIMIDLGASYPIREVRIYNRGDGDPSAVLPLILQFSGDGNDWEEIEERTEMFTRTEPWIVKAEGRRARFVRVTQNKQSGYIALSEIEVY
jgi:hypothetical protein